MRAVLVVNPAATTTTSAALRSLVATLESEAKLDVATTERRWHAAELAEQARRDGVEVVVVLGGDGTVNEVVNGLLREGPRGAPALAVVPGGSTNVFARALGLPHEPMAAAAAIVGHLRRCRRRRIGLGLASWEDDGTAQPSAARFATGTEPDSSPRRGTGPAAGSSAQCGTGPAPGSGAVAQRYFTFCAGLGLDAEVVRVVERRRALGRASSPELFISSAVRHFYTDAERQRPALRLEQPGHPPVAGVHLGIICNTRPWTYLGDRPLLPCPDASFETGLDLLALRRLRTVSTLRHLRRFVSRSRRPPHGRDVVLLHDADEFTLLANRPVAFQVDGDALGTRTAVQFRAVRQALDVLA